MTGRVVLGIRLSHQAPGMMRLQTKRQQGFALQALIYFFFEICLLRRAPQDLPASDVVFRLVLAGNLLIGILVGMMGGQRFAVGVLHSVAHLALLLSVLYGGLSWMQRRARFLQSATALLGTGLILGLFALIPIGLLLPMESASEEAGLTVLLLLALFAWSVVVTGHIVRHALDLTLGQGVAIAILYELSSLVLLRSVLPSA